MTNFDQQLEAYVRMLRIPAKDYDFMLTSIYQDLKIMIGCRLATSLSEEDIAKLQSILEEPNDKKMLDSLNRLIPDFDQLISEEFEKYKTALAKPG